MEDNHTTKETLERYLLTSTLTEDQKKELRSEFERTKGARWVFHKAVQLNGGKLQTKVPVLSHK